MPAMIENNMMAYKGEKPWHGLGFEVPANATGSEMLQIAGLNWQVESRKLYFTDSADTKESILTDTEDYRAIVRADINEVFQVASPRYNPLQNEEIVDFFKEYCEAGHARIETVGGLKNGRIVWALARLNGGSTAVLNGEDELRGYMMLASSHDGSVSTIGKATQVRVVCWNTLSAALAEKGKTEFKMKHSKKWTPEVAEHAKRTMGIAIEQVQAANQLAEDLSRVQVDEKGRIEFVSRLMGANELVLQDVLKSSTVTQLQNAIPQSVDTNQEMSRVGRAILESILDSPGADMSTAKNTAFGCLNGLTHYIDHTKGRTQDARLAQAWFGTGEQMKADAVSILTSMAGI